MNQVQATNIITMPTGEQDSQVFNTSFQNMRVDKLKKNLLQKNIESQEK